MSHTSSHHGILVLVRHGQSAWNEKGLWTGWTDIPLSAIGKEEAQDVGKHLAQFQFDHGFTSILTRAKQTMETIQKTLVQTFPLTESDKLNERNYGIYTGKNKWEIKKKLGEQAFTNLRRSWDYPIDQGESLKDVYARVIPYYTSTILPLLEKGKHIIIAAHGNSLRALMKYLEAIPDDKIASVELATGQAVVYEIGEDGEVLSKMETIPSGKVS